MHGIKVVLQAHVDNLGERGQIVAVSNGYARNYLLPRKLALTATPANLKFVAEQRRIWEVQESREVGEAESTAAKLAALELEVKKKAGEAGTLYGSVTTSEITGLLAQHGIQVDRRRLSLGQPIKTVGEHEVRIRLHPKVTGAFKLRVVGEGGRAPLESPTELDDRPDEDEDADEARGGWGRDADRT